MIDTKKNIEEFEKNEEEWLEKLLQNKAETLSDQIE